MVRILYNRTYHHLQVDGHAKTAEFGHDLLCSAVSILTLTLLRTLEGLKAGGMVYSTCSAEVDIGHADITWSPVRRHAESVDIAVQTVINGYMLIAEQDSEHVFFSEVG